MVGGEIVHVIDCAGRPVDFYAVDLCGRAKAEMNPRVILRQIASTAVDFIGLCHATSGDFDARIEGEAIALRAGKLETHPVASGNSVIAKDHWRTVDIIDYNVHVAVIE